MSKNIVKMPYEYFPNFNKDGPIYNGKIFIGEINTDPEIIANQKDVTYQDACNCVVETPIIQPIRTGSGGVPIYNNSPVRLFVDGAYSIKVLDKNNNQIYYTPNVTNGVPVTQDEFKDAILSLTLADAIAKTDAVDGVTKVMVSDRDGGLFRYVSGETPNGFDVIDATGSSLQLKIDDYKNSTFKYWGAAADGVTDDTLPMQAALSSIYPLKASSRNDIYLTTNTLFNQRSNRDIDFKGSTIKNLNNNRYALISIPGTLTELTDEALNIYLQENHYGQELTGVTVKNLVVEMSPNTGGGANLGAGMAYVKNSKYQNINIIATNGNGFEIRQCQGCKAENIRVSGHRSFGIFIFQSESCIVDNWSVSGGVRGLSVKHCRNGRKVTNNVVSNGYIINQSDAFWIAGGSNFEPVATPIYPTNHEITGNVLLENIILEETDGLNNPGISIGCFANKWTLRNLTFKNNNGIVGSSVSVGREGDFLLGGTVGSGHIIENCKFNDVDSIGNAVILFSVNHKVINCDFTGDYDRVWLASSGGPATIRSHSEFSNNKVTGNVALNSSLSLMGLVVDAAQDWDNIAIENNEITLTPIVGSGTSFSSMLIQSDKSSIKGNVVTMNYISAIASTFGVNVSGDSLITGNQISVSVGNSVVTRCFSLLGTEQQFALGNTIEQVGTSGGVTSGIRYQASTGQTANNMFIGTFTNEEVTY